MRLEGKTVVITGAGSGVGRAAAVRFAAEGAAVVAADLRSEWAEGTADFARGTGGRCVPLECDVRNEADLIRAIDVAVAEFGRLHVMYNNAGVASPRPGLLAEEHDDEDWDRIMSINLRGYWYGCREAIRCFKRQGEGGVIVNTGSVAGMVAWGGSAYGISKAGVNHMTRILAIECAPQGIRVNAVCPAGMPDTNFLAVGAEMASQGTSPEVAARVAGAHPLGRAIRPEDVAAAALYLASDEARNVTGTLLTVDGGYTAA